jgi:hypothetical protein
MAKQSVGNLNVLIGGDANPLVNELRRADTEARTRAASISGQMGKLGRDLTRNFSAAKFGKDILMGFGIGSAAGVAMTAANYFVDRWKESAQYAKDIEERAQNIAKAMRELREVRVESKMAGQGPEANAFEFARELAQLAAKRDGFEAARQRALRGAAFADDQSSKHFGVRIRQFEGESFSSDGTDEGVAMQVRDFHDLMIKRADEAQSQWVEVSKKLEGVARKAIANTQELDQLGKQRAEELKKAADAEAKKEESAAAERRSRFNRAFNDAYNGSDDRSGGKDSFDMDAGRWTRAAGNINVDDMTRRGMGTGANYKDVMSQTESLLAQILDAIRDARTRELTAKFAN